MEPSSPLSQDSASFAEEVIFEDYDFCKEGLFDNVLFGIIIEAKPVVASELMKDDLVFPLEKPPKVEKDQWLGEKLKLPPLAASNYGPPAASTMAFVPDTIGPLFHQQQPAKLAKTEQLLMEFDYVYGNVELTHLTPPQTPPQEYGFDCQTEQQQQQQQHQSAPFIPMPVSRQHQQQQQQSSPVVVATDAEFYGFQTPLNGLLDNPLEIIDQQQQQQQHSSEPLQQVPEEYELADSFGFHSVEAVGAEDVALEMELVEQIVRSRSQDLPGLGEAEETFSETRSVASPMSDTSSSSDGSSGYTPDPDDEWSPSSSPKKNSILRIAAGTGAVTKKRTRPYGRGIEDKKSRKKEQNKNAATRYRQKKKAEIEEILVVEQELKDKNEELRSKSADIAREIRYLKSLMREVCKAKGLI